MRGSDKIVTLSKLSPALVRSDTKRSMGVLRKWVIFLIFWGSVMGSRAADTDDALIKVKIEQAKPTQINSGHLEIESRMANVEIAKKRGAEALDKLMRKKAGQVVKGPGGQLFLIDGHHMASALYHSQQKEMYVTVVADWSAMPWATEADQRNFWKRLTDRKWTYLYDRGNPVAVDPLSKAMPQHVKDLIDDPHRSLAWLVRKFGGYKRLEPPYNVFQEFKWANYFRSLLIDMSTVEGVDRAVNSGLALSQSALAKDLPGYAKGSVEISRVRHCRDLFRIVRGRIAEELD